MPEAWFKDVEGRNCNKNKGVWDSGGEYWLDKHLKLLWMKVAAFACPRFQDGARTVKVYQGMLDALLCSLSYERRRLQAARTELSVKGGDVHMKLWRLAGIPLTHECMSVKAHLLLVVQVDSAGRTSVSYLLFWRAPEPPDFLQLWSQILWYTTMNFHGLHRHRHPYT